MVLGTNIRAVSASGSSFGVTMQFFCLEVECYFGSVNYLVDFLKKIACQSVENIQCLNKLFRGYFME